MSESTINAGVKMWFTAMPLYQGRLCDLLPLDISAIEEVMLQLFNGVEYMHRNRVLHKDIKPANILVKGKTRPDIVLADYGICASLDNLNQLVDPARWNLRFCSPRSLANGCAKNSSRCLCARGYFLFYTGARQVTRVFCDCCNSGGRHATSTENIWGSRTEYDVS